MSSLPLTRVHCRLDRRGPDPTFFRVGASYRGSDPSVCPTTSVVQPVNAYLDSSDGGGAVRPRGPKWVAKSFPAGRQSVRPWGCSGDLFASPRDLPGG